MASEIVYDLVQASDVERAFEIETAGFTEDEAASLESLKYRQQHAGDYFLGAYEQRVPSEDPSAGGRGRGDRLLIGYACSTLTRQPTLTHDAMSTHEPDGTHVAIHSVCVALTHRNRGIASALLREYLARLERGIESSKGGQPSPATPTKIESALLIAHPELVPLYERAGFSVVGPSAVVHGAKPWIELRRAIRNPTTAPPPSYERSTSSSSADEQAVGVREEEERDVRSPGRLLGYFRGGMDDLVDPQDGTNKVNLYCPRADCRCLLLRAGAGTWVQGTKHDIELPDLPRPMSTLSASNEAATPKRGYWSVSSPLAFENIGFSRNTAAPPSSASSSSTANPAAEAANIKYLTCADCDHGPLGWHDTEGRDLGMEVQAENEARGEGAFGGSGESAAPAVRKGREFLLAVDRVRYKVY
ncbi:hypothetical protein JCM3774_000747 [Rhodotorula dairenensis]